MDAIWDSPDSGATMTEEELKKWAEAHKTAGSAVAAAVLRLFERLEWFLPFETMLRRLRSAKAAGPVLDRAPTDQEIEAETLARIGKHKMTDIANLNSLMDTTLGPGFMVMPQDVKESYNDDVKLDAAGNPVPKVAGYKSQSSGV